jgi:hypothetical protein
MCIYTSIFFIDVIRDEEKRSIKAVVTEPN